MDKYFLDAEFIDDGKTIDLISIGIVCSDGRELYLQSVDFDPKNASQWVWDNVLFNLPRLCTYKDHTNIVGMLRQHKHGQCTDPYQNPRRGCPWRTRQQIRDEVSVFFNPSDGFELWGWCTGYDFVVLCQLFGTMMDLPQGWPHYIRDLQYWLDVCHVADENLPQQEGTAHNALEDARHIKRLWEYMDTQYIVTPLRKHKDNPNGPRLFDYPFNGSDIPPFPERPSLQNIIQEGTISTISTKENE